MKNEEWANVLRIIGITIRTKRARFSDNFIANAGKIEKRARGVLKWNAESVKKLKMVSISGMKVEACHLNEELKIE